MRRETNAGRPRRLPDALRSLVPVALVVGLSAPLGAEPVHSPTVEAGTAIYVDDLDTTVVSPRVRAGVELPAQLSVDVGWTADVISSASVDIVTSATRIHDVRHEIGGVLRRENLVRNLDADAGYTAAIEKDAYSHTVQGGLRLALLDGDLELALRLGSSFNRLGELTQPVEDWHSLWVHDLDLAATVVLDQRTVVSIDAVAFVARGYQASPYRRVPVVTGRDLRDADWYPESVPDDRLRAAGTLRVRRAFGTRWVVGGEYRLYGDDWGVVAHTESVDAVLQLTRRFSVRARERGTVQSRARFYRATYDDADGMLTRDRRLAPSTSLAAGLALQADVGPLAAAEPVQVLVAVDGLAWHYDEFLAPWPTFSAGTELRPLRWVRGLVGQVEVRAQW